MALQLRQIDLGTVSMAAFALAMAYMSQIGDASTETIVVFAGIGVFLILFALYNAGLASEGPAPTS